jgi:ubiquinone/menaquinone biosynthesis C-methylase UbiE
LSTEILSNAATEFDRWADAGRAESMERGHRSATEAATSHWVLGSDDVLLDVGCGNGWALRMLLDRGAGRGVGIDVSPGMVERARAASNPARTRFEVAPAAQLPLADAEISHVLSVEALYYTPDPARTLAEWARVTRPGGQLAIMIDLFAENPVGQVWIDVLDVEAHLLSTIELVQMAEAAGWTDMATSRYRDPRPPKTEADFEPSKYWPSYGIYRGYLEAGSLILRATRA